jgi:hypothetical protein
MSIEDDLRGVSHYRIRLDRNPETCRIERVWRDSIDEAGNVIATEETDLSETRITLRPAPPHD